MQINTIPFVLKQKILQNIQSSLKTQINQINVPKYTYFNQKNDVKQKMNLIQNKISKQTDGNDSQIKQKSQHSSSISSDKDQQSIEKFCDQVNGLKNCVSTLLNVNQQLINDLSFIKNLLQPITNTEEQVKELQNLMEEKASIQLQIEDSPENQTDQDKLILELKTKIEEMRQKISQNQKEFIIEKNQFYRLYDKGEIGEEKQIKQLQVNNKQLSEQINQLQIERTALVGNNNFSEFIKLKDILRENGLQNQKSSKILDIYQQKNEIDIQNKLLEKQKIELNQKITEQFYENQQKFQQNQSTQLTQQEYNDLVLLKQQEYTKMMVIEESIQDIQREYWNLEKQKSQQLNNDTLEFKEIDFESKQLQQLNKNNDVEKQQKKEDFKSSFSSKISSSSKEGSMLKSQKVPQQKSNSFQKLETSNDKIQEVNRISKILTRSLSQKFNDLDQQICILKKLKEQKKHSLSEIQQQDIPYLEKLVPKIPSQDNSVRIDLNNQSKVVLNDKIQSIIDKNSNKSSKLRSNYSNKNSTGSQNSSFYSNIDIYKNHIPISNDHSELQKINEINPIQETSPNFQEGMSFQKYFDTMEQQVQKIETKHEIKQTNFSFITQSDLINQNGILSDSILEDQKNYIILNIYDNPHQENQLKNIQSDYNKEQQLYSTPNFMQLQEDIREKKISQIQKNKLLFF